MKYLTCLIFFISVIVFAEGSVITEFLKGHPLNEEGSYNGLDSKAYIDLPVRSQNVHALVDYVHADKTKYTISLIDIKIIKSYEPFILAPYPVYSTHILSPAELEKRGQKVQTYGAISSEEGNGFCRSAFGPSYHLAKQNPTSSRKSVNEPWFIESVTCEGPR